MSDRYTDPDPGEIYKYETHQQPVQYDYQDHTDYGAGGVSMSSGDVPGFLLFIVGACLYPVVLDWFLTGVCLVLRKAKLPLLTAYKIYWLAALSPTIGAIWLLSSGPNGKLIPSIFLGFFVFALSLASIRGNEHKLGQDNKQ